MPLATSGVGSAPHPRCLRAGVTSGSILADRICGSVSWSVTRSMRRDSSRPRPGPAAPAPAGASRVRTARRESSLRGLGSRRCPGVRAACLSAHATPCHPLIPTDAPELPVSSSPASPPVPRSPSPRTHACPRGLWGAPQLGRLVHAPQAAL